MPAEELTLPHDIASPEEYLPGTPIWVWIVAGLAILALLFLAYFLIRRFSVEKTATTALGPNHYVLAAQRLEDIRKESTTLPIGRFASGVSLIFRECLSKVLNDPALFETDEETAIRLESLDRVPLSSRAFLIALSRAKYAPSETNQAQAEQFLEDGARALHDVQQSQTPSAE
ncbi:hypothetical protein N9B42_02375 [Akkermansiaceae bacterium]|nr:hypothetical protein [Akkermansiaceae bacterium]MDB4387824.1 hypothetical protein [Akkermansiaceae bacterium]MDB4467130.1 hypothetical protein [Akkermansiaceae bacterium]